MARNTPLAPMIGPESVASLSGAPVRSPKTAELVAGTLRRMVVDGQLKEGDFLPNEAELMAHFGVSRPTLREAVRVLESERLVEVRRGSRTGARVRVPGPEIVARPAGLLLELSGNATLTIMAGMLHEITVRHTAFAMKENRPLSKSDYELLMRSYKRLMTLMRSGDGEAAEAHWRKHLDTARELLLKGMESVKVRDVMI